MSIEKTAILHLNKEDLDLKIIEKYRAFPKLIEALDNWILMPDMRLLPKLMELSQIVNKLQPLTGNIVAYRGFNYSYFLKYQETFGLAKSPDLNTVTTKTTTNPTSFSTDIRIARAFGNIVLQTQLTPTKHSFLRITDELSYLVSIDRRNLKQIETQKEIIVFPNTELQIKVIESNKKPFWFKWN
jgi:hypothetical protein